MSTEDQTQPVQVTRTSKRLAYTSLFREEYASRFQAAEAANQTSFDITQGEFDDFMLARNLIDYIPDRRSREWAAHVIRRNEVRSAINAIAERELDGGSPAFRIDFVQDGVYRVNLFLAICERSSLAVAGRVASFVRNKELSYRKFIAFLSSHKSDLPNWLVLVVEWKEQELSNILEGFRHMLENHSRDVNLTYKQALAHFKANKPELLDAAPTNGDAVSDPVPEPDDAEDLSVPPTSATPVA